MVILRNYNVHTDNFELDDGDAAINKIVKIKEREEEKSKNRFVGR
jgi:hypothetical protein